MEMKRAIFNLTTSRLFMGSMLAAALILYGWALFDRSIMWRHIAFLSLISFSAVFLSLGASKKTNNYKSTILIMAGIITFGMADAGIATLNILSKSGFGIYLLEIVLHIVPSLCFIAAACFYLQRNLKLWHVAQLKLDFLVSALLTFGAIIIIFFDSAFYSYNFADFLMEPYYLILLVDSIMITFLIAVASSIRTNQLDPPEYLILLAGFLYAAADVLHTFDYLNGSMIQKSIPDLLYFLSFMAVFMAAILTFRAAAGMKREKHSDSYLNEGSIIYSFWMILPVAASSMLSGIGTQSMAYYLIIFTIYGITSTYIQKNISTEHLLLASNRKNESLEKYILEQKGRLNSINESMAYIAEHDKLTGMYNRDRFIKESDDIISRTRGGRRVYLIIIDIDRFRLVNESYGNEVGDEVLKRMADRIRSVFDDHFSCNARLDGNEFAVLCYGFKEFSQVLRKINQLIFISKAPMNITPFQIPVQIHVGVATYPENANNRTDLLKCAKIAVEQSKLKKMDMCSTYNSTLYEQEHRKQEIENALRVADIKKEFEVYYQPQYDVSGKVLVGMEALLRWNSPEVGLVCPSEFIPIAEETGLILEIGNWVMETAIKQIIKWNMDYGTELCVSINVSAIQIQNTNFIYNVRNMINKHRVNTSWINFEITESSAMNSIETYQEVLNELTDMGISVSIDDFGTGYSSYIYLKRASIDYLKIDKQLIDMISTMSSDAQIVNAIIAMAQSLEIKTIAEGVESKEQIELLNGMGCDIIQGYFYGEPMPADEFLESHLQKHTSSKVGNEFDVYSLEAYADAKRA